LVATGVYFLNTNTGERAAPLAHIDFESGAAVDFFASDDGVIHVATSGRNLTDVPPVRQLMRELPAVGVYEQLSGKPAPASLVEAQARAEFLAAQRAQVADPEPKMSTKRPVSAMTGSAAKAATGLGTTGQALYYYDCQGTFSYDEWFNCNFCYHSDWNMYDYTWMWVTGSGSYGQDDVDYSQDTVSVYGGGSVYHQLQYRHWYSWSTPISTYVQNGYYVTWDHFAAGNDHDIRSVVNSADGDSYHWCGNGDDY